jgi:hypothetical protein
MTSLLAAAVLIAGCDDSVGCYDICDTPPPPPSDSEAFVQLLEKVYIRQDPATFAALLTEDFRFALDEPDPTTGEVDWDVATERHISRRMFDPENIQSSEPQLDPELWLQRVDIGLSPLENFAERPDLYTTADPPGPLDPTRWIARGATYHTNVFFNLEGSTDYQVMGRAYFVVIEDRAKQINDWGKFLLYRWEDLGSDPGIATEPHTWTQVKRLYIR